MKKIFFLLMIIIGCTRAIGQNNNANAQAVQLAQKIAKKMKDTLDLSAQQRNEIYQANMNLNDQKQAIRQQNPSADSLVVRIQRVEKKRDSLYLPILGPEKYQLYLEKKRNLVNNN